METVLAHSGPSVVNGSLYYYRSRWKGKAVPSRGESLNLSASTPTLPPKPALGVASFTRFRKVSSLPENAPSRNTAFYVPF